MSQIQTSNTKSFNEDVVSQLVKLGYGTRDECINASHQVVDYNDINAIIDVLNKTKEKEMNDTIRNNNDHQITSLDDDSKYNHNATSIDNETWLSSEQTECLINNGYCSLDTIMDNKEILFLCQAYVRQNYKGREPLIKELVLQIATYYGGRYNTKIYLQLISCEELENEKGRFIVHYGSAMMSNLVQSVLNGDKYATIVHVKKVTKANLENVCKYIGHHKGKQPAAIAKPIRSVKMERIVEDKWDADYINSLRKKEIFQLIMAANYMDLPSLLHLGCAKIATLIKGKSPEEIKNILADDDNDQ